jgi:hypothetical protein
MQPVRVEESVVRAVPEPEFTETWKPVSHARVLDAMYTVLDQKNAEIVSSNYTLTANGARLFGSWVIDGEDLNERFMLGFRNSVDGYVGVGFCSGLHVTVCENMIFSGEFKTFHRHTKSLDDGKVLELASSTWDKVQLEHGELQDWHHGLKEYRMDENQLEAVSFRAMKQGLIPTPRFKDYVECLDAETKISDELSLHTFHGGVTRLIRNDSLFKIARVTKQLTEFCDAQV